MPIPPHLKTKTRLLQAWQAGVECVGGERVVREAVGADRGAGRVAPVTHLLAVGKAAGSMCAGALEFLDGEGRALVVTKAGYCSAGVAAHPGVVVIEAGHPLPDEGSLRAGAAVEEFVRSVVAGGQLVMLVSGGASALVEALPAGVGLADLRALNEALLAGGCDIACINAARRRVSRIKGGRLLAGFGGGSVHVYAISDVAGDDVEVIGGGIGGVGGDGGGVDGVDGALPEKARALLERLALARAGDNGDTTDVQPRAFSHHCRIIASNPIAREGAARFLRGEGLPVVVNEEALHRDYHTAARRLAADLFAGPTGAYIWGGEPTVVLPPGPGLGGRNQSLALALAGEIRGRRNITVLVAGTDGVDGPTNAAGALIDGDTFDAASGASAALQRADAGTYFARIAALFKPGPTGTNVMDLAIGIKE